MNGNAGRQLVATTLLFLLACADSPGAPSPAPPSVDDFPFGSTYASDLDASDVTSAELVGRWTFHFQESLVGFVALDGVDQITVHYEVKDGELIITDVAGEDRCRGSSAVGSYAWAVAGEMLTLIEIDDTCDRRAELLTAGPWTME